MATFLRRLLSWVWREPATEPNDGHILEDLYRAHLSEREQSYRAQATLAWLEEACRGRP